MEAVMMTPHTAEQSVAFAPNNNSNKQIRIKTPNNKRNGRGNNFISTPSESTLDAYASAGLLNPPSRAMSLSHPLFTHQQHRQNHQQPPLLPLPNVSSTHHHRQPLLSRSLSNSQSMISRKDRTRDTSLTPKKLKPTKREEATKKRSATTQSISEYLVVSSDDNRWGPDPKDLPKHLPVGLTSKVMGGKGPGTVSVENMDMLLSSSGSVVLSPPPSSLPLPKFSLRSKLSCNAEAGGVDAGATNNLRRLLRLR